MPAQAADSEARPYMPTFAQEVELIPDWVGRANAYLNDTGNGSLQATFPMLKLNIPLNMVAALNLLDDTNKGRVVANTRKAAAKTSSRRQNSFTLTKRNFSPTPTESLPLSSEYRSSWL